MLVRPSLAFARFCREIDEILIDGIVNGSAALTGPGPTGGCLRYVRRRPPGQPDRPGVYLVGDWSRGIQTGRLRNYLMFLAVALVGLFVGVFAWSRG